MNKIISYYLVLFMFFYFSCEKTVSDFEIEKHPERLVLNAIFYSDRTITVGLSKSMSIDAPTTVLPYVKDGVIVLFENDKLIDTLSYKSDGDYGLDHYPIPGNTYKLIAEARGFQTVIATMTMPQKMTEFKVSSDYTVKTQDHCIGCSPINIMKLKVFTEEEVHQEYTGITAYFKDAYRIECLKSVCEKKFNTAKGYAYDSCYCIEADTVNDFYRNTSVYSSDKNIRFARQNNYMALSYDGYASYGTELYLQGKSFGEKQPLFVHISEYNILPTHSGRITLSINVYNKPVYDFMYSLARAKQVEYDPFAEKVTIYGNIENGLGLFGGVVKTSIEVPVDYSKITPNDHFY